jgi:hypothetical protein
VKYVLPAAVAIAVGLITLISYFVDNPLLISVRLILTDWVIILAGLAVLVGVLSLLLANLRRVQAGARGWPYNLITAAVTVLVLLLGLIEGSQAPFVNTSMTHVLFKGVLLASQAALTSLVMFFLVLAAVRVMRKKPSPASAGFLITVVIVLLGWLPLSFMRSLNGLHAWLISVPASAGARGILLGVALGTVAVGLRVLVGIERPYKD